MDSQRELLLSQISTQNVPKAQSFFVNSWFLAKSLVPGGFLRFVARPVGALTAMIIFIFCSGIFGVSASKGSLPGDFFYPVKRTSEKMQVGFTATEMKKATLHVKFAEERVKEIEAIAKSESKPEKKKEKIKVASAGLKDEMKKTQETLDKVKNEQKKAKVIVEAVKKVDEKTVEISQRIELKKEEFKKEDKEIAESLTEAKSATVETGVKAVEVIVEKHEQGAVTMSNQEIKETIEKIDNKIDVVEQAVKEATGKVDEAAKAAENKEVLASGAGKPVDGKNGAEIKQAETIKTAEQAAVEEVKEKPELAEKKLTEAKELLNNGDLSSALARVKQSSEITTAMEASVKEINKTTGNE